MSVNPFQPILSRRWLWQYFFQYIEEHLKNKRQRESLNPCANTTNPCRWCEWSLTQNVITVVRVDTPKRNWMLTLKVYTRTPPPAQADHCLELKSVESEKDLWRETQLIAMLSPWSSVWRKTLFNLCKESRLWTDFSQEEERGGANGSKRCKGLHCKRVIYLQMFPKFSQNLVSFLCKYISWY